MAEAEPEPRHSRQDVHDLTALPPSDSVRQGRPRQGGGRVGPRKFVGDFGLFGGKSASGKPSQIPERRATERVHQLECKSWVGWKKFRGFSMNNALLVDISRGGARIFLDKAPPPLPARLDLPRNAPEASLGAAPEWSSPSKRNKANACCGSSSRNIAPTTSSKQPSAASPPANPKTRSVGHEGRKAKHVTPDLAS